MATSVVSTIRSSVRSNGKQVVVISGCDSGLGFSLAHRLLQNGKTVVAGCLRTDSEGAQKLESLGGLVCSLDVTDPGKIEEVTRAVQGVLVKDEFQLQAVVNNAGVMVFGEFEWQTPRMIEQQIRVNLLGPFHMAYAFLPFLQKHQGRLINVVSHCGVVGLPTLSVYSASKAALLRWSDALRLEQHKYGVKVISFTPGSFISHSGIMAQQNAYAKEMMEEMSEEKRTKHGKYFESVQRYLSNIPHPEGALPIPDEKLMEKLSHALFSPNAHSHYKHEPFRYALYHTLFKLMPTRVRDKLVHRFVQLPPYEP